MPLFDRARATSYSTFNRYYVSILYRYRDIGGYLSKVADFDPPHLHFASSEGATPVEFRGNLLHQKNESPWVIVWCCVGDLTFSSFSRIPTSYRRTDRQTHGHGLYHGCIASRGNKKFSYRRGTARCILSDEVLLIATQQCRNYLYDKSSRNRSYAVRGLQ